jgi:Mrp family chromosome partitioning ATPase
VALATVGLFERVGYGMSRVFSAMTGTGSPRVVAVEDPRETEDRFVADAGEAPFVEIGGPGGPVFSQMAPVLAKPAPVLDVKPKAEPVRAFPRIAASAPAPVAQPVPTVPSSAVPFGAEAHTATYLSVRFHDTAPRAPGRPLDGPDPGLVALHFPDHPVSGEYRTLRDEIARQLPEATSRALVFTAAAAEAGTTTVLLNLGITLAREGQRVLVLDANVTRPGVAAKLALRSAPGLAEVLGGQLPLPWALQPTAAPSMQALAAGVAIDAPGSAALGSAIGRDLPKLVGQLRQWFDWVLIDAGVWGVVPERDSTCSVGDAVYLVTRETDAERPEFTGLRAWVKQLGGALRGYVTTRV